MPVNIEESSTGITMGSAHFALGYILLEKFERKVFPERVSYFQDPSNKSRESLRLEKRRQS